MFLAKLKGEWLMSGLANDVFFVGEDGKVPAKKESRKEQDGTDEKAVLAVLRRFNDTLSNGEYDLHSISLPGMRYVNHRGDEVGFMGVNEAIELCRRLYDGRAVSIELLDVTVRVNQDVAMIWYQFRTKVDEEENVGSDMISLVKIDGEWKITALGDNYQ